MTPQPPVEYASLSERIRAAESSCPACTFGGYIKGTPCCACTFVETPDGRRTRLAQVDFGQQRRTEQRDPAQLLQQLAANKDGPQSPSEKIIGLYARGGGPDPHQAILALHARKIRDNW